LLQKSQPADQLSKQNGEFLKEHVKSPSSHGGKLCNGADFLARTYVCHVGHAKAYYIIIGYLIAYLIIPAKVREYVFTGIGLSVCLSVTSDHDS